MLKIAYSEVYMSYTQVKKIVRKRVIRLAMVVLLTSHTLYDVLFRL